MFCGVPQNAKQTADGTGVVRMPLDGVAVVIVCRAPLAAACLDKVGFALFKAAFMQRGLALAKKTAIGAALMKCE